MTAIYSACDDPAISAAKVAKVAKDKGKKIIVKSVNGETVEAFIDTGPSWSPQKTPASS